jgi:hypothetical protein
MISQCPTSFRHYTLSRLCPLTQDTHPRPSSHRTNSLPVFPISPSNTAHHTATRSNVPKSSRQRVTHICTIIHSASKSQKARMTQATRRGAGRPKAVRNMADDIMNLVDEHLAWQVEAEERELQRRGSVGTLIVDWDGTGEVRAFHRGSKDRSMINNAQPPPSSCSSSSRRTNTQATPTAQPRPHQHHGFQAPTRASKARARDSNSVISTQTHHHSHHTPPQQQIQRKPLPRRRSSTAVNFHTHTHKQTTHLPKQDDISVSYSPTTNTAHGYDPYTTLAYAYNGQNLHVHNDTINESFHVPVERYLATKDKVLPALPSSPLPSPSRSTRSEGGSASGRKTGKVLGFVKKVMGKLERVGVLGKMKGVRERERKGSGGRRF